jgi:hypothetical protein
LSIVDQPTGKSIAGESAERALLSDAALANQANVGESPASIRGRAFSAMQYQRAAARWALSGDSRLIRGSLSHKNLVSWKIYKIGQGLA